jgi:exosortase sorting signal-containing protein
MRIPPYVLSSLLLVLAMPASAAPPYYANLAFTPSGPGSCTPTTIFVPGTGTSTFNLPATTSNIAFVVTINAVAITGAAITIPGPFPSSAPLLNFNNTQSAVPLPYTFVVTYSPADNGVGVGTGASLTVVCAADGAATAFVTNDIPIGAATAAVAVPGLSPAGVGVMSLMLALIGLAGYGRQLRTGSRSA